MPSFDTSQSATVYEQPIDNRLGDYGVAFPVGLVIWIDGDDNVFETESITEDQIQEDAASGSGDFGKAIFRRGKTYEITAGEQILLDAAGYTTSG